MLLLLLSQCVKLKVIIMRNSKKKKKNHQTPAWRRTVERERLNILDSILGGKLWQKTG